MKISNKLKKIALFIDDPLQRINKYQYSIKMFKNYLFIINSFKLQQQNDKEIKQKTIGMINQLQTHSNFIQSKIPFYLNKNQAPKKQEDYICVFGAYKCSNISDDEIRKIIYQWQNFGYKNNLTTDKHIKTTQNSVY